MPSFFKSGAARARNSFRPNSKAKATKILTAELAAAERVNPSHEFTDQSNDGLEAVYRLMGPPRMGDGLWKCCMGHEQELVHWTGTHPFKYLQCQQCDHILCRWCATTEVLTPRERNPSQSTLIFSLKDETIHGQICPNCGLSHQARPLKAKRHSLNDRIVSFKGLKCPCGLLSNHTWLHFSIGPISHYRKNPYEAYSILTTQRAELSIRSRRTSPERHARRSNRSPSVSPAPRSDSCVLLQTPTSSRPVTADGLKPNTLLRSDEPAPKAWSLGVHRVHPRQDFEGRRPFEEPAYVVAAVVEGEVGEGAAQGRGRTRLQPILM